MSSGQDGYNGEDKISIALCTFNGAEYLLEQLESIAAQSLQPGEVVISDDRSDDNTITIAERFRTKADFPVRIIKNRTRLGVVNNFAQAIEQCENDYIALCDQDDLWLPDRLAISYRVMKEAEAVAGRANPLLVHSDLMVGNSGGRVIAPSFRKKNNLIFAAEDPLKNLLVQNFVTGCTVLINRALAETALPFPAEARLHDWWLALVAAVQGRIISIPEATVIYRQHPQNVIGSKAYYSLHSLRRVTNIAELEKDIAATLNQALVFRKRLKDNPDCKEPEYMQLFLDAALKNGWKTACTALHNGIGKYPALRNLIFLLLLSKGGYRYYL